MPRFIETDGLGVFKRPDCLDVAIHGFHSGRYLAAVGEAVFDGERAACPSRLSEGLKLRRSRQVAALRADADFERAPPGGGSLVGIVRIREGLLPFRLRQR